MGYKKNRYKLTPLQEKFCHEYVVDLNATQAYLRAGGTGIDNSSVKSSASNFLRNENIQKRIQGLQKDIAERLRITSEDVAAEYAKIAFSNIQNYFAEGNSVEDIKDLPAHHAAAVASYKKTTTITVTGNTKIAEEFKLHDKKGALDALAKHLGFFEEHNRQKNTVNYGEMSTEELKERLAASRKLKIA